MISTMPKLSKASLRVNERGVAHIVVIVILLAGLALGVYLITQKTAFFSRASSSPISGPLTTPYVIMDSPGYIGGRLTVNWNTNRTGGASRYDWVGIFKLSTNQRLDWFWNNTCAYGDAGADPVAIGSCTLTISPGAAAGEYEARLFNGDTLITKSSVMNFSMGTQPSISSSYYANPGSNFTIDWNSNRSAESPSPKEWIGIFNKQTNNRLDWFWTNTCGYGDSGPTAVAIGSCTINIPAGTATGDYYIKLFKIDQELASKAIWIGTPVSSPLPASPTPSPTSTPVPSATPTPTPTPGPLNVYMPESGNVYNNGTTMPIKWTSALQSPYSCSLSYWRNIGETRSTIATVPDLSVGSYNWTINTSMFGGQSSPAHVTLFCTKSGRSYQSDSATFTLR